MYVLLMVILGLACGTAAPNNWVSQSKNLGNRIIGGADAKRRQFPYQISLQVPILGHICGGSIISSTWVVSAAHCVEFPINILPVKAVAGLLNLYEYHEDVQAEFVGSIITHPKYNGHEYDIALLQLLDPFKFTEAVKPIALPNKGYSGNVWLSGWGDMGEDFPVAAHTLQFLEMTIITNDECNDIFAKAQTYDVPVGNSSTCTLPFEPHRSGCHGDSGGPIVQNGVLVGIVHGGDTLCGINYDIKLPNVFANVSVLIDFIKLYVTDL